MSSGYAPEAPDPAGRPVAAGGAQPEFWLTALTRATARVTANADRDGVLHALAHAVVDEFTAALAHIWLYDPAEGALLLGAGAGATGDARGLAGRIPISETRPLVVRAFLGREVLAVDAVSEAEWTFNFAWASKQRLRGYACFPLLVGERTIGALSVALHAPWPPLMLQAVGALARRAALAV